MSDADLNATCQELSDLVAAISSDMKLPGGLSFVWKDGSWWVAPVGFVELYLGVGVTFEAALGEFKKNVVQAGRNFLNAESEAYVERTERVGSIVDRYPPPSKSMEAPDDGHPSG